MTTAINLIINADDLGAGAPTDRGIFEAFTRGVVTSVSILANGPSFSAAAQEALALGVPTGVHLNLSEGKALTGPIAGLTDAAGAFPGKAASRQRYLAGGFDPDALRRELLAQIDRVRQAGLTPDHLDSHQHCALFPAVTAPMLAAAKESGILRMRLPQPAEPDGSEDSDLARELQLYRELAPAMARRIKVGGFTTPDGLYGMPLLDRLDNASLSAALNTMPPGTWELMVHPGHIDPQRPFAGAERECELAALSHPSIRQLLKLRSIRVITFSELPCAC